MDKLHLNQHISQQFNAELEQLRERVLAMGGQVEEQVAAAVRAVAHRDPVRMETVRANEARVNAAEIEIDEQCASILARRQPAASDLRLVLAVIKTIADLERIGDEAERIARLSNSDGGDDLGQAIRLEFAGMGEQVRIMLRAVLDAFARLDLPAAINVIGLDRDVDRAYDRLVGQIRDRIHAEVDLIDPGLNLLFAVRSLERIGDRCRNISEYVAYIVQGRDVRHTRFGQRVEDAANGQ